MRCINLFRCFWTAGVSNRTPAREAFVFLFGSFAFFIVLRRSDTGVLFFVSFDVAPVHIDFHLKHIVAWHLGASRSHDTFCGWPRSRGSSRRCYASTLWLRLWRGVGDLLQPCGRSDPAQVDAGAPISCVGAAAALAQPIVQTWVPNRPEPLRGPGMNQRPIS